MGPGSACPEIYGLARRHRHIPPLCSSDDGRVVRLLVGNLEKTASLICILHPEAVCFMMHGEGAFNCWRGARARRLVQASVFITDLADALIWQEELSGFHKNPFQESFIMGILSG